MRKHIIPFYLEAPTQTVASDDLNWNGITSKMVLPAFDADATVYVDRVAAQGNIIPGTLLVINQDGALTNSAVVTISYGGSTVVEFDATGESATLLFFDDRDSQDDAGWEVIAKDASVGDLSAIDLTMSGDLTVNGNAVIGDAATDTIGFFGVATPVVQPASADQAAVDLSSIADFPADGTASVADETDLEAVADAVRSLTTLTNQLRADLVSLGLIKGQA